jgi:2-methylcitrate dehydratase PrpD
MTTAAERLASFALELSPDEIPAEVADTAKLHLLDTLGCGLAAHALGVATEGRTTLSEQAGAAEATVIGLDDLLPAPSAAFANGMLSHGLDFDDTHAGSVSHVSAVVCPSALASAEAAGTGGGELLAAIVAGNESVARVGMAVPGAFHARGFHPTAVCGIFGGTVAAARLVGAGRDAAASALGIAGSFAGGLFAYLEDGTATKPMHPAWAAHGALLAVRLASLGAEGPPSVLEGRFGLYHAFVAAEPGSVDLEQQLSDLGQRWETLRIAYKPFPACHFVHASLSAAASLLSGLDPDDVDEVVVTLPEAGVSLVAEPVAAKLAPRTDYEAKFSIQYSIAAMLVHGRVGVQSYTDEALTDARVLELARRVRYEVRDYETFPAAFPGGARIRLRGGRLLEADLPFQKGAAENPMARDEVLAKYRDNAALALADTDVEELERVVLEIEQVDDVTTALAPLRRTRAAARV